MVCDPLNVLLGLICRGFCLSLSAVLASGFPVPLVAVGHPRCDSSPDSFRTVKPRLSLLTGCRKRGRFQDRQGNAVLVVMLCTQHSAIPAAQEAAPTRLDSVTTAVCPPGQESHPEDEWLRQGSAAASAACWPAGRSCGSVLMCSESPPQLCYLLGQLEGRTRAPSGSFRLGSWSLTYFSTRVLGNTEFQRERDLPSDSSFPE